MQTLSLTTGLADKWASVLSTSTAISNWVASNTTATAATIFVGVDAQAPPQDSDCPYIVIFDLHKLEGPQVSEFVYGGRVAFCITESGYTANGHIKTLDGMYKADAFGQVIYQVLAEAGNYKITSINYQLDPAALSNQYSGFFDFEIQVTPTLGGSLSF